jgi:hypothetical protein
MKKRVDKKRKAKAAECAAARKLKKQQSNAITLQKSYNTLNKGKRITLRSAVQKRAPRRGVVGAASRDVVLSPLPEPPPKTTSRGRRINVLQKFR